MGWLSEWLEKLVGGDMKFRQWDKAKIEVELSRVDDAQEARDVRITDAEKRLTVLEAAGATSLLHQGDKEIHRRRVRGG